ncbi:hypothetical protein BC827DRAFT_1236603 [Russula dissimulans]|nr:hypothetical protein BC827DRAFT_1236603 [Russula dissimulans]
MRPTYQKDLSFAALDQHVRLDGHEFLEAGQTAHSFIWRRVLGACDVIAQPAAFRAPVPTCITSNIHPSASPLGLCLLPHIRGGFRTHELRRDIIAPDTAGTCRVVHKEGWGAQAAAPIPLEVLMGEEQVAARRAKDLEAWWDVRVHEDWLQKKVEVR